MEGLAFCKAFYGVGLAASPKEKKGVLGMKRFVAVLALSLAFALPAFAAEEEKVPVIRMAYTMTTHQQGFTIALQKGEAFKDFGVWFKPVVEKEKYDLYRGDKKIARFEVIVTKQFLVPCLCTAHPGPEKL